MKITINQKKKLNRKIKLKKCPTKSNFYKKSDKPTTPLLRKPDHIKSASTESTKIYWIV